MSESPAEKRTRVLGAGPRRKRDTREMDSQMRAYGKINRRKLSREAQTVVDKIDEIHKLEEKIKLVDVMKADRNRPYHEAVQRVNRAAAELVEAQAQLERTKLAGTADVSDLDERQDNLKLAIDRIKGEIEAIYQKSIDASAAESA